MLHGIVKSGVTTGVTSGFIGDTSDFANSIDLANLKSDLDKSDINKLINVPSNLSHLKSKVDKLSIYKLETMPVDLSKLSDILKNNQKLNINKS